MRLADGPLNSRLCLLSSSRRDELKTRFPDRYSPLLLSLNCCSMP